MNMLEGEIVLFFNSTSVPGLKLGQPSFFIEGTQQARLFEEPTQFLHYCYAAVGQRPSVHTWTAAAQALRTWFQFLQAIRKDWREASADDRRSYRDAYLGAISPRTGKEYSPNTIGTRMAVIAEFYRFATKKGWYSGDMGVADGSVSIQNKLQIDEDAFAHTRSPNIRHLPDTDLPKRISNYKVAPLRVADLRTLLHYAGPQAGHPAGDLRSTRDRLMFDLGWAVGLRVEEISNLTTLHFLSLTPDPGRRIHRCRLS
jgi:site-specific recombinase XerD